MKANRRNELGVGCLLLLAMSLMMWMALQVGAFDFRSRIYVTATFDNAAGLTEGALVSVAGVQVGTVDALRLEQGRAVVELGLFSGQSLSTSTQARIRSRSVLGEKYVELVNVGDGSEPLRDGDVVDVQQEQVEIDQLISALGPLIEDADFESLHVLFSSMAGVVKENPELLANVMKDLAQLLDKGAVAADGLPRLMEKAEDSLGRLDRTLRRADALSVNASTTLERIDRLTLALQKTAERLPQMASDLEPAIADLKEIARFLRGQTDDVEVILENLRAIDSDSIRHLLREEGVRIRLWDKKEKRESGKDRETR